MADPWRDCETAIDYERRCVRAKEWFLVAGDPIVVENTYTVDWDWRVKSYVDNNGQEGSIVLERSDS
jgi:hypothetical protein